MKIVMNCYNVYHISPDYSSKMNTLAGALFYIAIASYILILRKNLKGIIAILRLFL